MFYALIKQNAKSFSSGNRANNQIIFVDFYLKIGKFLYQQCQKICVNAKTLFMLN